MEKIPKRKINTDLTEYVYRRIDTLGREVDEQQEQKENWEKVDVIHAQLKAAGQGQLANEYSNARDDVRFFSDVWMYKRGMQEGAALLLFLLGMDGPLGMPAGRYGDE